ncbi:hypothetical protein PR202_gb09463 [Eleusine coracana subsp. coracana]|uniref:KIB1-4 beta-propeller domain-containing protein n=1 Tax=Eleusine coracana subsp. coracana TaxID=191504 RepID=A0AAV5EFN8_ELECO|nr:hypothetical protein PR202_gb09463 [Eleusine coracana subsp. coracana]
MSEMAIRDWGGLPDLPLSEVMRRLLPCLRSLYAFAATCRPWRRLLRASAADLRPGLPPLLLLAGTARPFSPLVLPRPLLYPLLPTDATALLSVSRGHLLLRCRHLLVLHDALTGARRCAIPLPSPNFAYNYAALSPSHILVFHSQHAFFALPFPGPDPNAGSNWTKHKLPLAASFVSMVIEFRGRLLGLTHRAQLLEFHLGASPPNQTVQMLPTAGLPDAKMFERWHFGPKLVAAGDRLLLVLFLLLPPKSKRVHKVAVYGLDMVRMIWEKVENIGACSLFVDCAGKSTTTCIDGKLWCGGEPSLCCCSRVPYLGGFSSMVGGTSWQCSHWTIYQ